MKTIVNSSEINHFRRKFHALQIKPEKNEQTNGSKTIQFFPEKKINSKHRKGLLTKIRTPDFKVQRPLCFLKSKGDKFCKIFRFNNKAISISHKFVTRY